MATVEQPCYTLINSVSDVEPYNEMQLKINLGEYNEYLSLYPILVIFEFKPRCNVKQCLRFCDLIAFYNLQQRIFICACKSFHVTT